MTNYQNELRDLTQVLLQSEDDYAELTRVLLWFLTGNSR